MVQRAKDGKVDALQTKEVVERGDIVTVYEKSWVILKSPKGDILGLDSLTHATFEEIFKGGSDRQIRMVLHKGDAFIKSKNSKSRQSFFEVAAGSVVASLQKARTRLTHDPKKGIFSASYFDGKMILIDASGEQKFPFRECKRVWENGKMTQEDPLPLDDKEILVYKNFLKGKIPKLTR
jgi:hypothetical protein